MEPVHEVLEGRNPPPPPPPPPGEIGLRTKQAKDVADMITDISKVGPVTYPKMLQCDNGSEFKAEVTSISEKHEVKIQHTMTKYKHTHTAFVKALKNINTE